MSGGSGKAARAPALAALAAAAFLAATSDERSFGVTTDGQQMLSVSYALVHGLGFGVSRDNPTALPRAAGDAVARYGLGQSLAEIPSMAFAGLLRTAFPRVPTLPLFVLVPVAGLAAAAWALARAAVAMGAPPAFAFLAGVALPLATPLRGYAATDLSEPLQAACLAVCVAAAAVVRCEKNDGKRWQAAAGAAAGLALLTKSLLLPAVLPLLAAVAAPRQPDAPANPRRTRNPVPAAWRPRALFVFAAFAALWAAFEVARFGRLMGGYPGEGFTFPLGEGLLRLTVYPNKGLLFYAPVVLLAPLGFLALWKRDRAFAGALATSSLVLLAAAAAWWAWDGQIGWGPRLLVPALPAVVALAAAVQPRARAAFAALAGLGLCVNALAALVPFPGTDALVAIAAPPPWPGASGPAAEAPAQHLALNPSWLPIRIHARLLAERARGGDVGARLAAGALADLTPPLVPRGWLPPLVASPLTVGYCGRSWIAPLPGGVDPFDWAAEDQRRRTNSLSAGTKPP